MSQIKLIAECGLPFFGSAKRVGDIWTYIDADRIERPLRPELVSVEKQTDGKD